MDMRQEHAQISNGDRLFIGGNWVIPYSDSLIDVIDSGTEELFFRVTDAQEPDVLRAIAAARTAFDEGPWPQLSHSERAQYLRAMADGLREKAVEFGDVWTRETGVLHVIARGVADRTAGTFDYYADLADIFPFEESAAPTAGGEFGLLVREPVGVVAAIIPWNAALTLAAAKVAPALLSGCTVIVKSSPEAPGEGYLIAEVAEAVGLPPGVLNVLTADRQVSESLIRDPRVDKIAFTGSTAAGRRIASLCGERVARYTLELGGKSAAVVLDDVDLQTVAATIAASECRITGQVCSSLTRIIATRDRHDALVEALVGEFEQVVVGDPFDERTQMGPLATERQRDRVEQYIATGVREGATLVTGGGRPSDLERGWFIEPTVFADVDNASTIGQEEIFGPVLSVIRANDEEHAVALANESIYGLNASVFTDDVDRAQSVARKLRSGTVGHNECRSDFGVSVGGFKQSGVGREGGLEGVRPYVETKYMIFDARPADRG